MKSLFEDLRTEEQRALAETVRRFVSAELRPYLAVSPPDEFPRRLFSRLCAMGLGGIPFPAEYGGGGAHYAPYALVLEELAVAGAALAGTLSVHGLPQLILSRFGTDEQKRRYLPRLAGGELLGAFALTEPETGSDAAAIATHAAADGDGFLISGSKAWITHSTVADLFVVFARTGEREISAPSRLQPVQYPLTHGRHGGDADGLSRQRPVPDRGGRPPLTRPAVHARGGSGQHGTGCHDESGGKRDGAPRPTRHRALRRLPRHRGQRARAGGRRAGHGRTPRQLQRAERGESGRAHG